MVWGCPLEAGYFLCGLPRRLAISPSLAQGASSQRRVPDGSGMNQEAVAVQRRCECHVRWVGIKSYLFDTCKSHVCILRVNDPRGRFAPRDGRSPQGLL